MLLLLKYNLFLKVIMLTYFLNMILYNKYLNYLNIY